MLKVFNRDGKINFVDDKNTLVGYDMNRKCCEMADWGFSRDPLAREGRKDLPQEILDKMVFNVDVCIKQSIYNDNGTTTKLVSFALVGELETWYLVLSNCHNGYYSHGFSMDVAGERAKEGAL